MKWHRCSSRRDAALRCEHSLRKLSLWQIWRHSDGNSSGSLDKPKFYVFMRLVSLALQKLRVPSTTAHMPPTRPVSHAHHNHAKRSRLHAAIRAVRISSNRFESSVDPLQLDPKMFSAPLDAAVGFSQLPGTLRPSMRALSGIGTVQASLHALCSR